MIHNSDEDSLNKFHTVEPQNGYPVNNTFLVTKTWYRGINAFE